MIQAPKGTKDVLPSQSYQWHWIEEKMRRAALNAGYREIRTPVFEHTELFLRGVGDTTDIVQKEMYTFTDKGKRSITLKPEGTASVVRSIIEHNLYAEPLPIKTFYLNSPIFRYENPQSGRLREHHQFGLECFGATGPSVDAELITLVLNLLESIGIKNLGVSINSIGCPNCRPKYQQALKEYLSEAKEDLCDTCKERMETNPLRVLDCKVESCKKRLQDAPVILDYLCDDCREHFEGLKKLLKLQGLDFEVNPKIVRGLDYYTKTVFEIIMHSEREGMALCGGGRYDGLVNQLGGPVLSGIGFGMGMERILMELENQSVVIPNADNVKAYVCHVSKEDAEAAFCLTMELRKQGISAECDHMDRSMKAQFKFANKLFAKYIIMVGGDEKERGNVKVRNLETREEIEINENEVIAFLKNKED